jgi:hypothetical protein
MPEISVSLEALIMANHISRGEIISLLAGLPVAVAATTGIASAADNKAQFKYQDKPGKGGAKCSGCSLFTPPNACKVVTGKISPNGWCTAWAKKA